jgi:membrane dipeptidase
MKRRRAFLRQSFAITAGASLLGFREFDQTLNSIFDPPYLSFDFHSHPGLFPAKGLPVFGGDAGVLKTVTEMSEGHLTGAFFSLVADLPLIKPGPAGIQITGSYQIGDGWKEYKRQLTQFKELIQNLPAKWSFKAADLDLAFKEQRVAAFLACEGGDFLEGSAERVNEMYNDGVRSIQIVHYHPNELGDLQTESPNYNGLSKAGMEVVKRMNRLGVVVDVAHASFATAKAVCELSDKPVILSHSILKMDDSRPLSRRAITPEHAKLIAQTGGVIGAWPSGFNSSFDEFVENTLRLVDVAGVDHVGLGTDMDGNFKPVFNSYLQLNSWAEALKSKGLHEDEVKKVVGGNAKRVLGQILK